MSAAALRKRTANIRWEHPATRLRAVVRGNRDSLGLCVRGDLSKADTDR